MGEAPLLEIKGLGKRFAARQGREPSPWVIQGLSFSVQPGEFLTIVGPSGAGKSTLLNMIAQIDTVSEGEIVFNGEALASRDARALRNRSTMSGAPCNRAYSSSGKFPGKKPLSRR